MLEDSQDNNSPIEASQGKSPGVIPARKRLALGVSAPPAGRAALPASMTAAGSPARAKAGPPGAQANRFVWDTMDVMMLLKGIEEHGSARRWFSRLARM